MSRPMPTDLTPEQEGSLGAIAQRYEAVNSIHATALHNIADDLIRLFVAIMASAQLRKINWSGDVPAFNDGDPCVFRFNSFTGYSLDGEDEEEHGPYSSTDETKSRAVRAIERIATSFKSAFIERFGECHYVTVYVDGQVEVDNDYEPSY